MKFTCEDCGDDVPRKRAELGYKICLACGEAKAKLVKRTVVPCHKSNYMLVTDKEELKGLNKYQGVS